MGRSLVGIVVDCHDAQAQANFWGTALGHPVSERNTDEYLVHDPATGGTPMYFMNVPEVPTAKNRLHVDLGTDSALDDEVARLVGLGAMLVEMRQDPPTHANPDTWAVMADPEGNVFCVLNLASVTGIF